VEARDEFLGGGLIGGLAADGQIAFLGEGFADGLANEGVVIDEQNASGERRDDGAGIAAGL
jgi:hypothetical protein